MLIQDGDEVLRRQVHPTQLDEVYTLTKAAFLPTPNDQDMLSTLRGRVSPDEAYRRHTEERHLQSAGTWGVSVDEAESEEVPAWDDEHVDGAPPDHASLDFSGHPAKNKKKRIAKVLRDAAVHRGCLYSSE